MVHPLETVIRNAEPFVFICDSAHDRFGAMSYTNNHIKKHRVYYLDMGGLTASRGKVSGEKVYAKPEELPEDRTDLAVIWVHPHQAKEAVDIANQIGTKRVWFSFKTGHRDAVAHAKELGMEIVEIGRCPVHYMDGQVPACAAHTALVKLTGAYGKPPQTDPSAKRRELW